MNGDDQNQWADVGDLLGVPLTEDECSHLGTLLMRAAACDQLYEVAQRTTGRGRVVGGDVQLRDYSVSVGPAETRHAFRKACGRKRGRDLPVLVIQHATTKTKYVPRDMLPHPDGVKKAAEDAPVPTTIFGLDPEKKN